MTNGGWITMVLSVGAVVTLFLWCLYRVLSHNPAAKNVSDEAINAGED